MNNLKINFDHTFYDKCLSYKDLAQEISLLVKDKKQALIIPHINPDPDALCAGYAFYLYLAQNNIKSFIGLQKPLLTKYDYIFNHDRSCFIVPSDIQARSIKLDLIVCLDLSNIERSGEYKKYIGKVPTINIDHHEGDNKFGDIALIDENISSTCELLFYYFMLCKHNFDAKLCELLCAGIMYDTGGFRYSNADINTHLAFGAMKSNFNIDVNYLYEKLFENASIESICLENKVAKSANFFYNGKMVVTELRYNFLDQCNASFEDSLELVRIGSSLKGVDFSVFFNEIADGSVKISLRSKSDFAVNKIAAYFGGGGHRKAAGISVIGDYQQVKADAINYFKRSYEEYLISH